MGQRIQAPRAAAGGAIAAVCGVLALGACTGAAGAANEPSATASATGTAALTSTPTASSPRASTASPTPTSTPTSPATSTRPTTTPSPTPTRVAPPVAAPFDVPAVRARIDRLAAIGPRDAVSRPYAAAANVVADELRRLGYRVELQRFSVPAGVSWGVRVPGGDSVNVVADPPGFDASRPHVVIGAHLDTVPQAPGAEDNASGVSVMVELGRMLRQQPARLPVRLVAFGAEESRGSGSSMYAFGSRHLVGSLRGDERASVVGMVSLDRVGVRSSTVPVCSGGIGTPALATAIRRSAGDVPTNGCRNRASDHVSFERVGIPAARIGSVPYDGYHSADDVPSVIDRRQLSRVGAVVWSWLRSVRA